MVLRMTPIGLAIGLLATSLGASAQSSTMENGGEVTLSTVEVSASAQGQTELPEPYAGGQVAKGARLGA